VFVFAVLIFDCFVVFHDIVDVVDCYFVSFLAFFFTDVQSSGEFNGQPLVQW